MKASDQPVISYLANLYLFKELHEYIQAEGKKFVNSLPKKWKTKGWEALNECWEKLDKPNPSGDWLNLSKNQRIKTLNKLITQGSSWNRKSNLAITSACLIVTVFGLFVGKTAWDYSNNTSDDRKAMADINPHIVGIVVFLLAFHAVGILYCGYRGQQEDGANFYERAKLICNTITLLGTIDIPKPGEAPLMQEIAKKINEIKETGGFLQRQIRGQMESGGEIRKRKTTMEKEEVKDEEEEETSVEYTEHSGTVHHV